MFSDTEIMLRLFKPSVRLNLTTNQSGKSTVLLDEPNQANSSVTIVNCPDDTVIINVDKFEAAAHVFNCDSGLCKRADYALISEASKSILYIELKSSSSFLHKDIVHQFVGAQCFVAYCKEIVRRFWGSHDFMNGYSERFVSLVEISSSQRPIVDRGFGVIHGSPETFLKIKRPNRQYLDFNKLLGRKL
jgi:hypothetical protein